MNMTDPIADMLTRIRNASMARHQTVLIPSSQVKVEIARILKDEGYIGEYDMPPDMEGRMFRVWLKYDNDKKPVLSGLKRVSKPGLRVYTKRKDIPMVLNGLGVTIMSTPQGVMTGRDAFGKNLGGEVVAYVW
ncbi:MAG TPA: 30S ribosomal protein S8 [Ktedonobacteraceae bacterium]|jgi:small subunit ribosomal protein S8|nr:30S ribosomal protein S8 [Ktedonobacteraceae bacterium]